MSQDMREQLELLDKLGDVQIVDRAVDAYLEVGAMIRRCLETQSAMPMFTNVSGGGHGCRVLGAPASLSTIEGAPLARTATALGLDVRANAREILEKLVATRRAEPVPPVVRRENGWTPPCQEHILLGEDASLKNFPTPFLHDGDGGPYVNTWGTIIVQTPDKKITNWSIARVMMIDDKHMTGAFFPVQHLGRIWQMWADRGEPMPYAIVQGGPPGLPFVAGMALPDGVEEASYLGALLGEPVELVPCRTVDLEVPAYAELIIEGHVSPERSAPEGPMGEYSGFIRAGTSMEPVYTIEAITHRSDPIWPAVVAGEPVDEVEAAQAIPLAAEVQYQMVEAGLPVTMSWLPLEAALHLLVVSMDATWRESLPGWTTEDVAARVEKVIVSATRADSYTPRAVVLDDDVDPADLAELTWALFTRVHPTGRRRVRHSAIFPIVACYTPDEYKAGEGDKVVYDALLPPVGDRDVRSSFAYAYPREIQDRVLAHWPH